MRSFLILISCIVTVVLLSSCKSKSNPSGPSGKTFQVKYSVTGTVAKIDKIRYETLKKDTITVNNAAPGWSYTLSSKGNSGDYVWLSASISDTGKVIIKILGNGSVLAADTSNGYGGATVTISRGISLPY